VISVYDILLVCIVGLAFTLSKQPKKTAVGVCIAALLLVVASDYLLSGVTFYWAALGIELSAGYILWGLSHDVPKQQDRMYYRALSAFMACSCLITGLYIYDVGVYASHPLYAATSQRVGLVHAIFMVIFSDTAIHTGVYRKGVDFFDSLFTRDRSRA
jgi:hypothetical protein